MIYREKVSGQKKACSHSKNVEQKTSSNSRRTTEREGRPCVPSTPNEKGAVDKGKALHKNSKRRGKGELKSIRKEGGNNFLQLLVGLWRKLRRPLCSTHRRIIQLGAAAVGKQKGLGGGSTLQDNLRQRVFEPPSREYL